MVPVPGSLTRSDRLSGEIRPLPSASGIHALGERLHRRVRAVPQRGARRSGRRHDPSTPAPAHASGRDLRNLARRPAHDQPILNTTGDDFAVRQYVRHRFRRLRPFGLNQMKSTKAPHSDAHQPRFSSVIQRLIKKNQDGPNRRPVAIKPMRISQLPRPFIE